MIMFFPREFDKISYEELRKLYDRKYVRFNVAGDELERSDVEYFIDSNSGGSIRIEGARPRCTEEYLPFAPFAVNAEFFADMPQFLEFCKNPGMPVISSQRSYSMPERKFTHFNVSIDPSEWVQRKFPQLAGFTAARELRPTNVCVRYDADLRLDNVYLDFYGRIPYERLCSEMKISPAVEAKARSRFNAAMIESVMIYWTPLNGGRFRSWLYEFKLL